MIVIGADTHKRTHTAAAVFAASGRLAGELTAAAIEPGFRELLAWGRQLSPERIWAIEDCRHVSGSFERFLVASGEQVVRVPPKLMGEARRGERQLNCALHRIAVTQGRVHAPAREFLARKRAEGKSTREALRCLKRHLARRVWRLLIASEIDRSVKTVDSQRGSLAPQIAAAA